MTGTETIAPEAPLTGTETVTPAPPLTGTETITGTPPLTATATVTAGETVTTTAAAPGAVLVEVRSSADGVTWSDWRPAPPDAITDPAAPITLTYSSLLSVPQGGPAVRWAQVRVTLAAACRARPRPR